MIKKLIILSSAIALSACSYINVKTEECRVTGKESITTQGKHEYRVYSSCGTFIVEDQPSRLSFNSADKYGAIEVKKTYKITSSGYRIPALSMFKSIISME